MMINLLPHQKVVYEKHGLRKTRLYRIWANMKTRCYNRNDPHYPRWGGKGIRMCDEWIHSFKTFYDWAIHNGYSDELSIDRINGEIGYEPSNCRWVTVAENNRNKKHVKYITFNGKTQTIGQWTKELNLGKETIRERLKRGWTIERALQKVGDCHHVS